jgi:hypothetical protein
LLTLKAEHTHKLPPFFDLLSSFPTCCFKRSHVEIPISKIQEPDKLTSSISKCNTSG